ncbi:MAG: hypothetical protein KA175_06460 [Flavobacteriales bacterium]|nr:hypothetical protein [Flavobacteriales bacterium]MBP6697242.1 hypothetical protein [Flavobacteriales bacterium]
MRRALLIFAVLLALGAGWYGWREYHRTAEDTADLEAAETIEPAALLQAFTADENAANSRFNGKVLEVHGVVRTVNAPENGLVDVVFETGDPLAGVVCQFAQADLPNNVVTGAQVRIKGLCTGLLMDVVLQRCALVE